MIPLKVRVTDGMRKVSENFLCAVRPKMAETTALGAALAAGAARGVNVIDLKNIRSAGHTTLTPLISVEGWYHCAVKMKKKKIENMR